MKARARVAVACDRSGATRLSILRSEPPLLLRPTPGGVYLVGGAAGPLRGDDLRLEVDVAAGATLVLRSAAASVALPGTPGATSRFTVEASVGAGGTLHWLPESSVAAAGCCHRATAVVRTEDEARLLWREMLVLGRHDEAPGSYWSRIDLEASGRPVLRHEIAVGPAAPGWDTSAVIGNARGIGTMVVVDPAWTHDPPAPLILGRTAAVFPLGDGCAASVSALAPDCLGLRATLEAGLRYLEAREWSTEGQPGVSAG